MDIKEPALDTMLKGHMGYMTKRQQVIAQNIANIDTPRYRARDLAKLDFKNLAAAEAAGSAHISLRTTSPRHLNGTLVDNGGNGVFKTVKDRNTFEISPDQNNVVLEDQMAKVSDTSAQFQLSSTMLRKFTQLYRSAAGNR